MKSNGSVRSEIRDAEDCRFLGSWINSSIRLAMDPGAPFTAHISNPKGFVSELGWRVGLFRGLEISLLKIIPEVALKFAVYEEMKQHMIATHSSRTGFHANFLDRLSAGGIAGFVSHLLTYPMKVVQTRLSNQRPFGSEFKGMMDAFVKIYQQTGFFGFYRGFLVSCTAMVPSMALDFAFYGKLKKLYKEHYHTKGQHPPAHVLLACGTIASSMAHLITYPLILPRIRLQAGDARALLIQTGQKTVFGYLMDSYREDGLRKGLYRGLTPSLSKVVPAVSLSFLFYEKISQWIVPSKTRPSITAENSDIRS